MIRVIVINIIKFILLVLIQILILNPMDIGGVIHPMLYILFILTLPFETPRWLILVLGFFIGIIIDIFSNSLGIHAAAATLIAFSTPIVWRILAPHDGYEIGNNPSISSLGAKWFIQYVIILTFIHHTVFFFIEAFSMKFFFSTIWTSLLNTIFTVILMILSQLLVTKRNN